MEGQGFGEQALDQRRIVMIGKDLVDHGPRRDPTTRVARRDCSANRGVSVKLGCRHGCKIGTRFGVLN